MRRARSANGASSGGRSSRTPPALTAPRISPCVRYATIARHASTLTAVWASSVLAPRCGVSTTFSSPNSGWSFGGGSTAYTSRAAPAIFFSRIASATAYSSTTSPRLSLTISRFGRHLPPNSRSRLIRCLVSAPPGT